MHQELAVRLAEEREPIRPDRLPVHRSESPTAIPRRVAPQQSLLPLDRPPAIVADARSCPKLNAPRMQPRPQSPMHATSSCRSASLALAVMRARAGPSCQRVCHLYFARRLTFVSCADNAESYGDGAGTIVDLARAGRATI
jgi:hypothetical protein